MKKVVMGKILKKIDSFMIVQHNLFDYRLKDHRRIQKWK